MKFNLTKVADLQSGAETIQLAHEPHGTLVQYFKSGGNLQNKSAMITLGNYDNVVFEDENPRFTTEQIERFGIKSLIGLGGYGYYKESAKNVTRIKIPINYVAGQAPPSVVSIGQTDKTITYHIQNHDIILYEWFRFSFTQNGISTDFVTSQLSGEFEKPFNFEGGFSVSVIGYRNEIQQFSRPTEPLTINIILRSDNPFNT
jgi:hypothetical protein